MRDSSLTFPQQRRPATESHQEPPETAALPDCRTVDRSAAALLKLRATTDHTETEPAARDQATDIRVRPELFEFAPRRRLSLMYSPAYRVPASADSGTTNSVRSHDPAVFQNGDTGVQPDTPANPPDESPAQVVRVRGVPVEDPDRIDDPPELSGCRSRR
jgi:hypothetical protein